MLRKKMRRGQRLYTVPKDDGIYRIGCVCQPLTDAVHRNVRIGWSHQVPDQANRLAAATKTTNTMMPTMP